MENLELISTESFNRKKNQYLDILLDPGFQEVKRLFVLLFYKNENGRTVHTKYYLSTKEIKEYIRYDWWKKHF